MGDQDRHNENLSDEEVRRRLQARADIMTRAAQLAERVRSGHQPGSGIPPEELADFLSEHGLAPRQERIT